MLVIAPFEREKSTMTGYFDATVVLDDDDVLPGLGQLLYDQAQGRAFALGHTAASPAGQKTPVLGFSAAAFLVAWRECVVKLDLQEFVASPYQARHGGASWDYIIQRKSEEETRARSPWSTTSAARSCRKPELIQQLVACLKPGIRELEKEYGKNYAKLFRNGSFRAAGRAAA